VVLLHDRRQVVHFNVTAHPTALWTAQQLIEAFPEETAPRFLLRDRDSIYGEYFRSRVAGMGVEEVVTAARPSHLARLLNAGCREIFATHFIDGATRSRASVAAAAAFGPYTSSWAMLVRHTRTRRCNVRSYLSEKLP